MYNTFGNRISSDSFRVVVGVTNLRTEQPDELVVSNYYLHPQYDHNDLLARNDLALIELSNAQPQASVDLYEADASALTGFSATVMGWGATDYSDPTAPVYPNELRHAVVPIVSRDVCNAPISYQGTIANTQVCAGFTAGGVDSCVGDSGGPLVTNIDGRTAQVGIVSFGNGCAEPFFYGVYTNIGAYIDWIDDYVQIDTVGTPLALAGTGGFNGGAAGDLNNNPSTGGAAWLLLWLVAGVAYSRRK
jgi:secreted trypsin-like serine protease